MKSFTKNKIWLRTVFQVFFFILIALIAVNHVLEDTGEAIRLLSNASLHAVCPFGGVVSLYQFATVGNFTQKIQQSSLILMILVFNPGLPVRLGLLRLGVPVGELPGVGWQVGQAALQEAL